MNYTITLTAAEDAALSAVALSQDDWIQNAVHERCRIAIDEIVGITVQKCLDNGVQLPGTKDDIVALAFERGWVKTAAQRHAEAQAEAAEIAALKGQA
jgi:hypothetical protein